MNLERLIVKVDSDAKICVQELGVDGGQGMRFDVDWKNSRQVDSNLRVKVAAAMATSETSVNEIVLLILVEDTGLVD